MTYPSFNSGDVLTATDMNAVGMWLVKTQTITNGVSTVTVTGAFSADYENYLITVSNGATTTNQAIHLRLGSKVTNYKTQLNYADYNNTPKALGSTTDTVFTYCIAGTTIGIFGNVNVGSPFLTQNTFVNSSWNSPSEAGTFVGQTGDSTSYTAFTLIVSGGATSTGGAIRVYGMRK